MRVLHRHAGSRLDRARMQADEWVIRCHCLVKSLNLLFVVAVLLDFCCDIRRWCPDEMWMSRTAQEEGRRSSEQGGVERAEPLVDAWELNVSPWAEVNADI